MERDRRKRKISRYDRGRMSRSSGTVGILDTFLRARLRESITNQKEVAKRIGRSQGWLNKYINGSGKATIDDVIRLVAIVLLGVDERLTREQRKLLRDWESVAPEHRKAAKQFFALWRERRPAPRPRPSGRGE
jgi:hypothetical protein